jgi:hypothetical protein
VLDFGGLLTRTDCMHVQMLNVFQFGVVARYVNLRQARVCLPVFLSVET